MREKKPDSGKDLIKSAHPVVIWVKNRRFGGRKWQIGLAVGCGLWAVGCMLWAVEANVALIGSVNYVFHTCLIAPDLPTFFFSTDQTYLASE